MKSALLMSMDFNALLPPLETPFHTDGREGFFHLLSLTGNVEEARMIYLIRDHDSARFAERKAVMEKASEEAAPPLGLRLHPPGDHRPVPQHGQMAGR